MIRHALKRVGFLVKPVAKAVLSLFFKRKYLRGRHFDASYGGYFWGVRSVWQKNILRLARPLPWPSGLTCYVSNPDNLVFHPDDINNFQSPGIYLQNFKGTIHLGRGTYIAPNVGIITANHRLDALDEHEDGRDVVIGEKCWIGMNAVILPGVVLGDRTVVAAGAVVTRSFPQGRCVIGGTPAKILKEIEYAVH